MQYNEGYERIGRSIVAALKTGGRITIGVEMLYVDPVPQTTTHVHKECMAAALTVAAPLASEEDELRFAIDYVQPMALALQAAMSEERAKANAQRGKLG
jgi:hypothetical protein